jgi:DNA-binding MarR family transcriptional regulator
MKNNTILRWRVALLLLEHGEDTVVRTLADIIGQTPDELQKLLHDINKVGHTKTKKAPTNRPAVSVNALLESHPEKAAVVKALKDRYENRTLFPELKDVRRFLERHAQPSTSLKSRVEATPKILRVLIDLPLHELETMLSTPGDKEFSGLGVISDQILGRNQK